MEMVHFQNGSHDIKNCKAINDAFKLFILDIPALNRIKQNKKKRQAGCKGETHLTWNSCLDQVNPFSAAVFH